MTKILIIGAYGKTAQLVTERLLSETNNELKLFLRNSSRLDKYRFNDRVELIDGDVTDMSLLKESMKDVDIVYSNVGGVDLAEQSKVIIQAMKDSNLSRLIFISSLGTYHEVPGKFGEWNEKMIAAYLPGFRESAKLIEDSGLVYTMIRPSWMSDKDEIDYETTQKGEPLKGTEVSRRSIADLVIKIIESPADYENQSIGINKPNTDGDMPEWYR
ncbi:SDR family oxidoreductase [Companilactobacillus metriopterae]|uniref:SDR family oxidoreductase n=1 Tax=Companilactobacillus metriopterae TaxID=1909267 RepID=UPI00100A9FE7|nr:SDR family oxidoreductase [Companilactobacillus metriopterae]